MYKFLLTLAIFLILIHNSDLASAAQPKHKKGKGTLGSLGSSPRPHAHRPPFISLSDVLKKDKKSNLNKKVKNETDAEETLNKWIKEVDETGILKKIFKRRLYIPEDSSLSVSSQVSRPNIFPNIFNQGEGFIVDAVIEWPVALNLHKLSLALYGDKASFLSHEDPKEPGADPATKSDFPDDFPNTATTTIIDESYTESEGKSLSTGFIGIERCLIYEQVEVGMSIYLDISRNQSHDCVLRAICEAQQVAEYYPAAPTSIFFEVVHLILKPSLSQSAHVPCYKDYLVAEKAAYDAPSRCSPFVSRCPLNIAGLFVRNFFPEIL